MTSMTRNSRTLDATPPPLSAVRTTVLALATVTIVARLTDSVHGGLGVALPEPVYHLAGGLTLAAAIAALGFLGRRGLSVVEQSELPIGELLRRRTEAPGQQPPHLLRQLFDGSARTSTPG